MVKILPVLLLKLIITDKIIDIIEHNKEINNKIIECFIFYMLMFKNKYLRSQSLNITIKSCRDTGIERSGI